MSETDVDRVITAHRSAELLECFSSGTQETLTTAVARWPRGVTASADQLPPVLARRSEEQQLPAEVVVETDPWPIPR